MKSRRPSLSTETHTLPDGRTLAYTNGGAPDGFPVVVNHGTPGSRLFAALLSNAAAAEGVRLVTPDRPGYGRSSPPPDDWTWRDWRNDLTELLRGESIDRGAVVGFSGGGPFALAAAKGDWARRVGLISSVVPPAETGLARLARIPFALRLLFRLSSAFARVSGPGAVVGQYTERSVPESVARAVADDFHEALRQGARAVERESESFATRSIAPERLSVPVRAWHGVQDDNAPIDPVRRFVDDVDGTLITADADHLGVLLDRRKDVFKWLRGGQKAVE